MTTTRFILLILLVASMYSGALALHGLMLVFFGLAWGLLVFVITLYLMRD